MKQEYVKSKVLSSSINLGRRFGDGCHKCFMGKNCMFLKYFEG